MNYRLIATILFFLLVTSCTHNFYFKVDVGTAGNKLKTNFSEGSIVQIVEPIYLHGGSIAIYNDFSFNDSLIISLKNCYIEDSRGKWKLHFLAENIGKDQIRIDGDDNKTIIVNLPPWIKDGDTVNIDFSDFMESNKGIKYPLNRMTIVIKKE
jgi:hypothetical protein